MTGNSQEPRVDLIVYGHDGRGLGHLSKSVAVALAVRRLAPELSVLLVTGAKAAQVLIGDTPLDFIKLPSYEVVERQGESYEVTGPSNIPVESMVALRKRLLADLICLLRPRCALVDYYAAGKLNELESALQASAQYGTGWVLGMRAVVGADQEVWSELAVRLFKQYYRKLLIYSDPHLLHEQTIQILSRYLSVQAVPVGYVSRALELEKQDALRSGSTMLPAGIAVFPWLSDASLNLMETLLGALGEIGASLGPWTIYVGAGYAGERKNRVIASLRELGFCRVEPVGTDYLAVLKHVRVALVYAGYNTLTDLLWAGTPSIVVVRKTSDDEQIDNARLLQQHMNDQIVVMEESGITVQALSQAIRQKAQRTRIANESVNYNGAEQTALELIQLIQAHREQGNGEDT